jgi:hypothetical protein
VSGLDFFEFAGLIGMDSIPEINGLLEIQPELRLGTCETSQTESSVRGHGTLSLDDFIHSGIRDAKSFRRVLLRDSERNQEILEEYLPGMCGPTVLGKTHCYFLAFMRIQ